MKLLFIGGTGLISSACASLAISRQHNLFIINRSISSIYPIPEGARLLQADIHGDEQILKDLLVGHHFDAVVDFIAFKPEDIERDIRLFNDRTAQFIFISSASVYQKPPRTHRISEEVPLVNPFWQYSRDKIACEELLIQAYRDQGFPATIVRPSHTYGPSQIPFSVGSWQHPWSNIQRIIKGKKIIVPGDGTSLWVLTWNDDFAKGLLGLLGNYQTVGQAFNITSDEILNWNQITLEVFHALDLAPNIIHIPSDLIAAYWPHAVGSLIGDKSNSVVFDNSRIKRVVPGFTCSTQWTDGVRRSLAWFADHPEHQTVDDELEILFDRIIAAYEKSFP